MVKYSCYRCGYTINDKTKILKHFNRKNICKPKINDINIDECKEYILKGLSYEQFIESIKSHEKVNDGSIKSHEKVNKKSKDQPIKAKEKKEDDTVKQSMNDLVNLLNTELKEIKK